MLCLYCELGEVTPDDYAGLCVSCQWAVRLRMLIPIGSEHAFGGTDYGLIWPVATPENPLGCEGSEPLFTPVNPALHCGPNASPSDIANYREELLALATRPPTLKFRDARQVIAEIRACGAIVALDRQLGMARIDKPARVPYAVLVEFLRLQDVIEDELSLEDARRIQSERRRSERLRERFGYVWSEVFARWVEVSEKSTPKNVQLEHFEDTKDAPQEASSSPASDGPFPPTPIPPTWGEIVASRYSQVDTSEREQGPGVSLDDRCERA